VKGHRIEAPEASRETQSVKTNERTIEPTRPTCEPLVDAKEAARILRIHPKTVKEMAGKGHIPGLKIGSVWRFRASALDEWVNAQLQSSSPFTAASTRRMEGR